MDEAKAKAFQEDVQATRERLLKAYGEQVYVVATCLEASADACARMVQHMDVLELLLVSKQVDRVAEAVSHLVAFAVGTLYPGKEREAERTAFWTRVDACTKEIAEDRHKVELKYTGVIQVASKVPE